jgi:hypothetical protein
MDVAAIIKDNMSRATAYPWETVVFCRNCPGALSSAGVQCWFNFLEVGHANIPWYIECAISHDGCYQYMLSFLPPMRSFFERARLFSNLRLENSRVGCLIHPRLLSRKYNFYKTGAYCADCDAQHKNETEQMIKKFFLAGCLGLLPELARAIIQLAVRTL